MQDQCYMSTTNADVLSHVLTGEPKTGQYEITIIKSIKLKVNNGFIPLPVKLKPSRRESEAIVDRKHQKIKDCTETAEAE